jgi:hypothetical protein
MRKTEAESGAEALGMLVRERSSNPRPNRSGGPFRSDARRKPMADQESAVQMLLACVNTVIGLVQQRGALCVKICFFARHSGSGLVTLKGLGVDGWITEIRQGLRLSPAGVILLVDGAVQEKLGPLVRALLADHPDLDVLTRVADLWIRRNAGLCPQGPLRPGAGIGETSVHRILANKKPPR